VAKEGAIVLGALLFVFGFLGYIVPIHEFGSVTDLDSLCSSPFGQLGQAFVEEAREVCQMASGLSKLAYGMMGVGAILVIIGAVIPNKKHSMFICGICNVALSTEAELYNHNNSKEHLEKASQLPKEEIQGTIKKEKVLTKAKLKKSPALRGVLIGVIAVVVFWGIFGLFFSQGFTMANDALSPDVYEGDVMHYERIPFNEINDGDIIVFVPLEKSEFSIKVGKVRHVFQNPDFVRTSSNVTPNNMESVYEKDYIGKITSITSEDNIIMKIYSYPFHLVITGVLLGYPIAFFIVRNRRRSA